MNIKTITNNLDSMGIPLFWQVSSLFFAISSIAIYLINDPILVAMIEIPRALLLLYGIPVAALSHTKKEYARTFFCYGSILLVLSLITKSLSAFDLPISQYLTFAFEQFGLIFILIFAFFYTGMFEKKFNIKGIAIDISLLLTAFFFFYLLIFPETMKWLLYSLNATQQLTVISILISSALLIVSVIHYGLSKSIKLPDIIRLSMTTLLLIHFSLDFWISLGLPKDPFLASKLSTFTIEFNGALLIIYMFSEKLDINYTKKAPKRISQNFLWTASIVAILTVPVGLLLLSLRGINTLNLFVIGIFSLFLSSIVIWRILLLLTKSRNQRKRLQVATQTNQLTGLPNYQGYIRKLTLANSENILVIAINIEDFKAINDLYGRHAGDQVLINLAEKLAAHPNSLVTAHSHSDLFLAVFQTEEDKVEETIQSLKDYLGIWNIIDDKPITVPLTFGASHSKETINPEILSQQAEQALNRARNEHTSFTLFIERRKSERLQRHEIRDILQQAIDDEHLPVHFQPIYNLDDGSLKALELLIRIDSKKHGLLLPGQFLDQAKAYGLLTALTQVCVKMVAKHYENLPDVVININLPPYMLKSSKLLNNFINLFEEENLPPNRFCIEITEDEDITAASLIPAIQQLKDLGFSIAMDDFGTGYSSLDKLSMLDIDTVKIDRSLLLSAETGNTAILEWAISLAKRLGVFAVVEGVETTEQLSLIKRLGADSVQGFLYSRPVSAQDAASLPLNSNNICTA